MANDLAVSSISHTSNVESITAISKVRQTQNNVAEQTGQSVLESNIAGIQTTEELKRAEMAGVPVTISDAQVVKTIERANKALEGGSTSFEFSIHKETNLISIKIIDKETGKVLREIPSEKTLQMVQKMWELSGMLVDERR